MSHTYNSILIHCVFSTKGRQKLIVPEIKERLWAYLGGIAREQNMKALAIGGTNDHIHLLLSLPTTLSVAKAVQLLKGSSSKWVHDTFPENPDFAWQEGYGAFSLSISHLQDTMAYIHKQEEHHRLKTFEEELISFLKKHGIEFDEQFLLG